MQFGNVYQDSHKYSYLLFHYFLRKQSEMHKMILCTMLLHYYFYSQKKKKKNWPQSKCPKMKEQLNSMVARECNLYNH